jgi:hypothetical protein
MTGLFFKLRWIATLAIVTALSVTGVAFAAHRPAVYSGAAVTSAGNPTIVTLETTRSHKGRVTATILGAPDACFGAATEGSRALILNGQFALGVGGGTTAAGFAAQLSGQFSSARSIAVVLHSAGWYYPINGPPNLCDITTTVQLNKL